MSHTRYPRPARGFTLLELMIVVAISLVVAAVAIPSAIVANENFKLRSTASNFGGVVQKARMLAVARNGSYPVATASSGGVASIYVNLGSSVPLTESTKNSLQVPRGIAIDTSGGNPSATSIVNTLTPVYRSLPQFNSRGLPCFVSSGVCNVDPAKTYITYLRQDRSLGGNGWAAINVTPAGHVQVWTWDGSAWE